MSFFGSGSVFTSLGDDDGIDWNDVIDAGANATAKILTAKYAANAAIKGANPYAVQSILGTPGGGQGGALPVGYAYNAAGQIVNTATGQIVNTSGTVAGLAGGVAGGIGGIFDSIARSLGISTSTLFLFGGGALLLYLLPSPRRR
jgi:hypothetical protein